MATTCTLGLSRLLIPRAGSTGNSRTGDSRPEESEPILRILSLAEEVPFNVQMLAHNCWDELHRAERMKLTVDLVETVFEK